MHISAKWINSYKIDQVLVDIAQLLIDISADTWLTDTLSTHDPAKQTNAFYWIAIYPVDSAINHLLTSYKFYLRCNHYISQ